ncbi:uncharacterized protein J3R85_004250 [Psidium guajava]|nr:uncharacterized protein J3R85_004250 [Psidium guajava]
MERNHLRFSSLASTPSEGAPMAGPEHPYVSSKTELKRMKQWLKDHHRGSSKR